jgi:dUTP pyrophosphatase
MSGRIGIALRWLDHGRGLPVPAAHSDGAAGMDIAAALASGERLVIAPGKRAMVPAGFAMALPPGYEAQIRPRSGLAAKHGVTVLNSPGTIDADYRGEVKVVLINHGDAEFVVERGDRIAQMVIAPVTPAGFTEVDLLDDTARGEGGYGSTGAR